MEISELQTLNPEQLFHLHARAAECLEPGSDDEYRKLWKETGKVLDDIDHWIWKAVTDPKLETDEYLPARVRTAIVLERQMRAKRMECDNTLSAIRAKQPYKMLTDEERLGARARGPPAVWTLDPPRPPAPISTFGTAETLNPLNPGVFPVRDGRRAPPGMGTACVGGLVIGGHGTTGC